MTVTKEAPGSRMAAAPRQPRPRREGFSALQWGLLSLFCLYCLLPLWWVITTMNKDNGQLFSTFGLWFSSQSHLADNFRTLLTRQDGIFTRWLLNQ